MIDFSYLRRGLDGLANAHRAGSMAGHLGASLVAGYCCGEDHGDWPEAVCRGIEAELDRVVAGEEAIWFDARKAGGTPTQLFRPLPAAEPVADAQDVVVTSLKGNGLRLRQSGHNVIFATLALRAVHDHGDLATPAVMAGVRRLIAQFDHAHPGRGYYGKDIGWNNGATAERTGAGDLPAFRSVADMVAATVAELVASVGHRRQGFGGLWHLINHAAALTELVRFGHADLADRLLPAHHRHLRLWRSLPDVTGELGLLPRSAHDPREPAYWEGTLKRDQARLTHRIKTLFGYHTLRGFVEDAGVRSRADEAFLHLMA